MSLSPAAAAGAVDLTNCDREPIHLLGAIQPLGFLIAATSDWIVSRVSANAPAWLGQPIEELLGANLATILPSAAVHTVRNLLAMLRGAGSVERAFALPLLGDGRHFDIAVHLAGGSIILEFEPSEPAGEANASSLVRTLIGRLQRVEDVTSFYREAARQMRALTGFDRVMIYKFHPDGSGEVIAESLRAGMDSFLGLRYPASDIPRQARALYEVNLIRLIADVNADAVPILPLPGPGAEALDLSLGMLRSVSPIHIEYLRNMRVGASMSASILHGGKLWGLFACHHAGPRHVGCERRTTAELFAHMFALLLSGREREVELEYEAKARRLHNQLMASMAAESSAFQNMPEIATIMADLIPCDGVGVWVEGQALLQGLTPTREEFLGLVRFLNRTAASSIYANDEIARAYEPGRDFTERSAGLLAIPVSRSPRDYVVFFRREVTQAVTWAGNPDKPVTPGPNGTRLTPRKSFEAWREVVRGRSKPWTEVELRVAESLRVTLLEVILRLSDAAEKERKSAAERQDLLIAELNHRVRNILGLIRGLISQSRSGADSIEHFANVLGGRIQALARAHDQITTDQWGPAPLRSLIESEAAAYLNRKGSRVLLQGPDVLLQPQAFSTLALVIHELMTNSAKYGALCDGRGTVEVNWAFDAVGCLVIEWLERGGPAVQAPTRRGFGSTIIERAVPHDLKGEARIDYHLAGVQARFVVPEAYVLAGVAERRPEAPRLEGAARLEGDALLVEDNMIIALDAEEMLRALGASRVHVAGSVAEALDLIKASQPAFAVLDVNLGRETSFPIASRLRELGVPHIFATGYGEDVAFPPEHAETPIIKKPYSAEVIAASFGPVARPAS